ncbi:MAG: glycoside hydrolase family 127 protein [Cyclobacteriaceae bacterium]
MRQTVMRIKWIALCVLLLLVAQCKEEESRNIQIVKSDDFSQDQGLVDMSRSSYTKLTSIGIDEVVLTEGFWADRVKTGLETMIPEMWSIYTSDVSNAFQNFEIAAGLKKGKHIGAPFHDGDFYKLIEAVSMAFAITKDEKYTRMIDEVIPVIAASQRADGYIHTPVMIETRNNPESAVEFRDRMDFESYNMGHLIMAAIVHSKATGQTTLLDIAIKAADYLYQYTVKFPEKMAQNAICPSHYMGVVELYRLTGDQKYLELARQFIDIRRQVIEGSDHNQDRIPFREQTQAVGHAVRANYLYAGVADVYAETGDESLKKALDLIWEDLTTTKLYVTAGCGALYDGVSPNGTTYKQSQIQQVHQAYGREYELPNAAAHNETCANIGNVLWNWRMFQLTADSKYTDLLEVTLMNSVLSGVNLNGKGYFYTNPLSHQTALPFEMRWPNVREPYISKSNCCPPNTIRTIVEVGNYLYSKNQNGLWLNMYAGNKLRTMIGEDRLQLTQRTKYPWDGFININIEEAPQREISLNFRIPDWCEGFELLLNGEPASYLQNEGYVTIVKHFSPGEHISLSLDMPIVLVESNPLVESTRNQVAVKRGPLVYCLEGNDLDDGQLPHNIIIPSNIEFKTEPIEIAGVELVSLKGNAIHSENNGWDGQLYKKLNTRLENVPVTLIPYFAWANREEKDMAVWLALDRQ